MAKRFDDPDLIGYTNRPDAAPGRTITFHVSTGFDRYEAHLVRLIRGERQREGSPVREEIVPSPIDGVYPGASRSITPGSYIEVPHHSLLAGGGGIWLQALICPTTPGEGGQAVITRWDPRRSVGYALMIDRHGRAVFLIGEQLEGTHRARNDLRLQSGSWYLVGGGWDGSRSAICCHAEPVAVPAGTAPLFGRSRGEIERKVVPVRRGPGDARHPLVIAARPVEGDGAITMGAHFNGRIEAPLVGTTWPGRNGVRDRIGQPGDGDIATWDFSQGITGNGFGDPSLVFDVSGNGLHGRCVNLPVRAVPGHNWDGRSTDFTSVPHQYGAIRFHDDALEDAGWEPDFSLTVPEDLSSGVYAAKLTAGDMEEYLPFFVRPAPGSHTASVAVLFPTNTYLAYGNDSAVLDVDSYELAVGVPRVVTPHDLYRYGHRELGNSLYDTHSDGSGVCYASWRRPLLNLGPLDREEMLTSVWLLNADLNLVDWLHEEGHRFDALTDQDLHDDTGGLLEQYRVVITGTHPEYWTAPMLDALEGYLSGGGRLMYLGGNGFYWVTAYHPRDRSIIEVRRWGGTEAWTGAPGEKHLSFSGEIGGLWRNRGRAPQRLVGVGFTAQGFDRSGYYVRLPDSYRHEARWIFEGVGGHRFGDFGLAGGGAAGMELDCYDPALGSPSHALVLATSHGHSENTMEARENFGGTAPGLGGPLNPSVRADMVYFTTPHGGGVFSTGSIAWCGSLSHDGYDNDIARITGNVLRQFLDDAPLPPSGQV